MLGPVLAPLQREPCGRTAAIAQRDAIACEFAGVLNGMGAKVVQLYRGKRILRGFDGEVEVSNETNFAIFYYYRDGDWDLY